MRENRRQKAEGSKQKANKPALSCLTAYCLLPSAYWSASALSPQPSALLLLGVVLLAALFVLAALSRHKKSARREFDLTGRVGSVVEALRPEGAVLIDGEL